MEKESKKAYYTVKSIMWKCNRYSRKDKSSCLYNCSTISEKTVGIVVNMLRKSGHSVSMFRTTVKPNQYKTTMLSIGTSKRANNDSIYYRYK